MTFRSTLTTVFLLMAASGLAGIGCGGLGVSASFSTADQGTPGSAPGPEGDGGNGGAITPAADAGTTPPGSPSGFLGNPLCRVPSSGLGTCEPEQDNSVRNSGADARCRGLLDAGPTPTTDAGDVDGGAPPPPDPITYACHVQENVSGTEIAPVCLPEGTSTGPCAESQACKAGFECTGSQTGECRRYCCDPTTCDATTFCDVQRIHGMEKVVVPVCMPIVGCQLLTGSQCPGGQTCGIVDDGSGLEQASCVDVGPRVEGEECETDHCAKDYACLGSQGSRKCFRLCETKAGAAGYACAMGQTCKTNGVVFKDGNVGICSI